MDRSTGILRLLKDVWPLLPAAIYLFGFLLIVISYLVGLSLTAIGPSGEVFPTFKSYAQVFASHDFRDALVNTLVFMVIGTPLELLIGLVLALIAYRLFFFRTIFKSVLLIPLAIPALVTATLLLIIFDYPGGHANHVLMGHYGFPAVLSDPINWRGSKLFALGVSMAGKVWRDMPISMLILLAGLISIDPELIEAAKSMGAGLRQRLRFLVLPLIIPSMAAVVLLRSIEMWKEFIFPFVLAGRYSMLGTLIESLYNGWGYAHQAAVVALVLVGCIVITSGVLFVGVEVVRKISIGK